MTIAFKHTIVFSRLIIQLVCGIKNYGLYFLRLIPLLKWKYLNL